MKKEEKETKGRRRRRRTKHKGLRRENCTLVSVESDGVYTVHLEGTEGRGDIMARMDFTRCRRLPGSPGPQRGTITLIHRPRMIQTSAGQKRHVDSQKHDPCTGHKRSFSSFSPHSVGASTLNGLFFLFVSDYDESS